MSVFASAHFGACGELQGVAEILIDGIAPAIASALQEATGVWVRELPYTPERVRAALRRASDR